MDKKVYFEEQRISKKSKSKKYGAVTRMIIRLHLAGDERGAQVVMISLALAAMVVTGYDLWDAFGRDKLPLGQDQVSQQNIIPEEGDFYNQ